MTAIGKRENPLPSEPRIALADGAIVGNWWQRDSESQRIVCKLCPRECNLKAGDRGFCFVRENRDDQIVLSTYGRSTGFCIDPIEKKPLNHFLPGTAVLSFGTAGCNLGCQFCQNWDISKSREVARLSEFASPEAIARAALATGCSSVAFTYNDPVIWAEYAIDTAKVCREVGVKSVAVTAGYISPEARGEFFGVMDAANVDLKAFSEEFYSKITYSHLAPVLDTLRYLKQETNVWFELTNLIIPRANDSSGELRKMCDWIVEHLGVDVPVHFTAFHPDFRMTDRERTEPAKLLEAFAIAKKAGIRYPYVGNVHDVAHQSTYCHACGELLIERDWYCLGRTKIDKSPESNTATCQSCQSSVAGVFADRVGTWGPKRQPIRISDYATRQSAEEKKAIHSSTATSGQLPMLEKELNMSMNDTDGSTKEQGMNEEANPKASDTSTPAIAVTKAQPTGFPKPLDLNKLTGDERALVLTMASNAIYSAVTGHAIKSNPEVLGEFSKRIVMGAFVTLKRGEILRGCCGVLGRPMSVGPAVNSAALRTAKEDQRMAAISPSELPFLTIDVTLLGPFHKIAAEGAERAKHVKIGKQGVMITRGKQSGLLLPSVAVERGWNATQFLQAVCTKARLPMSAWESSESTVTTFDGTTISSTLASQLPVNIPNTVPPPLTEQQLSEYAQTAGRNIVAIATGGTPSYVLPHLPDTTVNALVLSMQWASKEEESAKSQGNLVQVSFRPGLPLQSSLFQLCQNAAGMFLRTKFNGELQLGLTIGTDPAFHGYGEKADLEGMDTSSRAVVISDPRHCGFIFNPEKTADELREIVRQNLPIGSRDGLVHSVQFMSTMPQVISISAPNPTLTSGERAAAVAGKFYPAEDAARRALVESLVGKADANPESQSCLACMVPHAGLKFSGRVAAKVWQQALAHSADRTLIIISPKHTASGINWAVSPCDAWGLSSTTKIAGDPELAQRLVEAVPDFRLDAGSHTQEHGIEVQLPLLERLAPNARVVGITMHGGSIEEIREAAKKMAAFLKTCDQPPLMVISSDMNHYATDGENRRRDRLALDSMATGDPEKLIATCRSNEISMCGLVPAAFVMETLRQLGHEITTSEVAYATSSDTTGDKSQVVGYSGLLLV